jgi:FAD/FMN-containing dehydrogenase
MKGASSVDDGVVIDLKNLDQITLNTDKTIVSLGPGNKWKRVYEELGKDGLAVAGGRAGDVGVGGYTLGGGISFFASARGWGCDNVRNFELVSASGEILNVNYKSYPDLFWGLRGGGTNFGIVTRFEYETFPQGDLFAGSLLYDYEHKEAAIKAFATYAHDADPKTATWLSIAYAQERKLMSALAMYAESKPDAAALQPYLAIPSLHSTAKVRSMADMAQEIADVQVQEHRQNYWNHTFKFDVDFVSWLTDMYWEEIVKAAGAYEGKQGLVMVMQIYTKESVALMQREGGNCLGLTEDEAPYLNFMLPSAWLHEKEDEVVFEIVKKIHGRAIEEGKRRGLYKEFIYMNYASVYQDAVRGYGKENYNRLKAVAGKYDPDGVFQTLMPGYFKLNGAPLVM